jgi:hypothetical protein
MGKNIGLHIPFFYPKLVLVDVGCAVQCMLPSSKAITKARLVATLTVNVTVCNICERTGWWARIYIHKCTYTCDAAVAVCRWGLWDGRGGKQQDTRCVHPLQGCHGDMIRDGRAQRGRLWVGLLASLRVRTSRSQGSEDTHWRCYMINFRARMLAVADSSHTCVSRSRASPIHRPNDHVFYFL